MAGQWTEPPISDFDPGQIQLGPISDEKVTYITI